MIIKPALLPFFLAALPLSARAADTYQLKFVRPNTPGEKGLLHIREDESQTRYPRTPHLPTEEQRSTTSAILDATAEIRTVDPRGRPTALALTIHTLAWLPSDAPRESLPPGSQIDAIFADGKATFTLHNGTLTDGQRAALAMACSSIIPRANSSDEETLYDGKPKHVGDTWPMQVEKIVAEWKQIQADPKDASGQMTLKRLTTLNAKPALEIVGTMTAKRLHFPDPHISTGTMSSTYDATLPLDPTATDCHTIMTSRATLELKPQPSLPTPTAILIEKRNDFSWQAVH